MKKIISAVVALALLLLFENSAFAQVPQGFNYQAIVRDASGNLMASQSITLKLSIHQGSASGTVVYGETHALTTNQFGLITATVGQGTVIYGTFSTIAWSTGNYWLQVEFALQGSIVYSDMGTSQLLSVPFALYAENSGNLPVGTSGQTLRHDGTSWIATNNLFNNGTYIGIGTTSPGAALHVMGNSRLDNANPMFQFFNGTTYKTFLQSFNNDFYIGHNLNGSVITWTNGTEKMRVTGAGNVGIGTTSPNASAKLHVAAHNKYAGYFTSDSLHTSAHILHAEYNGAAGSGDVRAVYGKSVPSDNYGIGGEFIGGYRGVNAYVYPTGSSSYSGLYAFASGGSGTNYGVNAVATGTGTNYGLFASAGGGTNNYAGFFNAGNVVVNSGKLGVGTSSPRATTKLQVTSTNRYAGYFETDSASAYTHAIHAVCTNTGNYNGVAVWGESKAGDSFGYGGIFISKYTGVYGVASNSSTSPVVGVSGDASSSVAGTAYGVWGYALTAAGTSYGVVGQGATSVAGGTHYGVFCSGSGAYTGTWTQISDKKFKNDITDYSDALSNILKLRPVTYTMKTEDYPFMNLASGTQIGFVAQEMEEVFPTLVENGVHPGASRKDAGIDYKGINYIGLIPVLVRAIQEQQVQIEKLEQRIIELESK